MFMPRCQLAETSECYICKTRSYWFWQPGAQSTTLKNKKVKTTDEFEEAWENISHQAQVHATPAPQVPKKETWWS